ncbi:hypothetical protein WJX72_011766 [[Myrmecia] bisecta]|uniref:Serine hydrolase domain-containing protein n=1 Tax=[Myrmecia] bisecta TaxID=41462 RepID=A0AAW1PXZ0_9CHLO
MASKRKLRILALHSFRTSGTIFQEQMRRAGLDTALEDLVEIIYATSPRPASGPPPEDVHPYFQGPYYEWWNAETVEGQHGRSVTFHGWDTALSFITDFISLHGPFDGVMGFSQGTILTSLLVGLQQQGAIMKGLPHFRFCLLFAGLPAGDPALKYVYDEPLRTPSLHVMGEKDFVLKYSKLLAKLFKDPIVIMHPRGHVIPALKGDSLETMRSFLQTHQQAANL